MRLLVLYEELAAYFMACIAQYSESTGCDVLIIAKKPNKVAPFKLSENDRVRIVFREDLAPAELEHLCDEFNPQAIFSGGWGFKPYRKICKQYRSTIPVLLGFDNWWTGSKKQRLIVALSRLTIQRWYNCCFVPGAQQKAFATRLGFKEGRIETGAYCCDSKLYTEVYKKTISKLDQDSPKRLLFLGRYEEVKGIRQLWSAFERFREEHPDWELYCAGKGSISPKAIDGVKHFGFVQPERLIDLVAQSSVFVLPSTFEPWGVVIHEMAIAGMPIITTPQVGAGYAFVKDGNTGHIVNTNETELYRAMCQIAQLDNHRFRQMAEASHTLGSTYTTTDWATRLTNLLERTRKEMAGA